MSTGTENIDDGITYSRYYVFKVYVAERINLLAT